MSQETPQPDAAHFGEAAWVYCASHRAPHGTGWCSVHVDDKTLLQATNYKEAVEECRRRGFNLYVDEQ